jgi:hypothetical protein
LPSSRQFKTDLTELLSPLALNRIIGTTILN